MKKISLLIGGFLFWPYVAKSLQNSNQTSNTSSGEIKINTDVTQDNLRAFLLTIQYAEGTNLRLNPYSVTYAFDFEITDFSDHPKALGWPGVLLSSQMCKDAGFASGVCRSTAAGAYQFIYPTWQYISSKINLKDFSPAEQDRAAVFAIQQRGALEDVLNGRVEDAIYKCAQEWASFPTSPYNQPQKSIDDLVFQYTSFGGYFTPSILV